MNITLTDRNAANVGGTSVQEEQTMNEELKGHLHITTMKFEVKRNERMHCRPFLITQGKARRLLCGG